MKYKVSIIISTFQRQHLLRWSLFSLAKQDIPYDFETIVVNDAVEDESKELCRKYQEKLNLKYIFSGQRNLAGELKWRVPGYAINIGVQQSTGQVIIISCAEMFHLNNTIRALAPPVLENPKIMAIPAGWDDREGSFLQQINNFQGEYGSIDIDSLNKYPKLDTFLPFLMAVSRDAFFSIGGYDEDFTGMAFDDNDLVGRLQLNGCSYLQTDARTIHLYHPRIVYGKENDPAFLYNKRLYISRKGSIIRNKNREWGRI